MVLGIVLLAGGALRFAGIGYGLPYTYRPDEPTMVVIALRMLKSGDLNPHWFGYPSLLFDLNAMAYGLYFILGHLAGSFGTTADLPYPEIVTTGVGFMAAPTLFLISRGLTALTSTGTVPLTFLICRRLHANPWTGIIAAALVAVSPTAIASSQSIAPDSFALFFLLLSFWGTIRLFDEPKLSNYALAGLAAGIAVSAKYNAALIVLPMMAVPLLKSGWRGLRSKELYFALVLCGVGFLIATPFALLDLESFLTGARVGAVQYAVEGHAGQEGNAFQWYTAYLLSVEGAFVLLGCVQAVRYVYQRNSKGISVLVFPVAYFVLVSQLVIRNERTILLIIPFLGILAAVLVVDLFERVDQLQNLRRLAWAGLLALSAYLVVIPLQSALALNSSGLDTREIARRWLESNLPPGARVAQEPYTPYLSTQRFTVQGVSAIVDHSPAWYKQNGFEYLILNVAIAQSQPAKYSEFLAQFDPIAQFGNNASGIQVFKTGVALPPHRVAARYGDYGEHVELIGYDDVHWAQGDPLQVHLYWRALDEKPEPYEVELRLLGQSDREIAKTRSDLFQGKGWQSGMFDGTWTVAVPPETAPGSYHLQVNVIWMRYAYSMPAQNWTGQRIDPVLLGPIEMQAH